MKEILEDERIAMYPLAHMGIPAFLLTRFRRDLGGRELKIFLFSLMLPDIIDKPLGHLLLSSSLNNGRIYAHTLLFLLSILIISVRFKGVRWVALGVATHHLMDLMFLQPTTYLWPYLGPFPRTNFTPYSWVESLLSNPVCLLGEVVGGPMLGYMMYERGYLQNLPIIRRFFKEVGVAEG